MKKIFRKNKGDSQVFRGKTKEGLSPVVTTVLLIALTIIITIIIFLWFRGMVEEGVTKFGENIQLACDKVEFEASYSEGIMSISNTGNIPIFRVDLKTTSDGNYVTKDIKEFAGGSNWPTSGLGVGGVFSGDIGGEIGSPQKITILPVLIGTSSKGKKTFMCQGQYGKEIEL
jgi:FlaG/FlaF family flagellin (archaellin)